VLIANFGYVTGACASTLAAIVTGNTQSLIDDLMPWNFAAKV
jgi:hypothetical protein